VGKFYNSNPAVAGPIGDWRETVGKCGVLKRSEWKTEHREQKFKNCFYPSNLSIHSIRSIPKTNKQGKDKNYGDKKATVFCSWFSMVNRRTVVRVIMLAAWARYRKQSRSTGLYNVQSENGTYRPYGAYRTHGPKACKQKQSRSTGLRNLYFENQSISSIGFQNHSRSTGLYNVQSGNGTYRHYGAYRTHGPKACKQKQSRSTRL
jgi:hypothetical protein